MREKKENTESAEAIYLCCNSKVRIVFDGRLLCALFCLCPFSHSKLSTHLYLSYTKPPFLPPKCVCVRVYVCVCVVCTQIMFCTNQLI